MPNARLTERAPFFAEVDVLAAGTPSPRRVWGTDVSETGMFLQTTHPFRVGDRVSLRFDCSETPVHVRAAEVMWVRPFEPVSVDGSMPGVGLKFVALDPPSRAALRKFIAPHLADTTLPETPADQLAALPPPVGSLPPITGSIVMKTTGKQHLTDEMFAVSLPPFSQPPLNISVPPDESSGLPAEVRVFQNTKPMGTPAPITIGPKRVMMKGPSTPAQPAPAASSARTAPSVAPAAAASTPPRGSPDAAVHPLAGWRFRKDDEAAAIASEVAADDARDRDAHVSDDFDPNITAINFSTLEQVSPTASPSVAAPEPPAIAERRSFERGLDLRFDDEPASKMTSLPPDELRLFDMSSTPPAPATTQVPDEDAILAIEQAVLQGDLAIRHLPIAEERRASPKRRVGSRALPMALVLLCSGTLVGVVVGTVVKRMRAHVPSALATADVGAPTLAPAAPPAPVDVATRGVADIERDLVQAAATPDATTGTSAPAATLVAAQKPAGPIVSAPPPLKDAPLPRKAEAVLTSSAAAPRGDADGEAKAAATEAKPVTKVTKVAKANGRQVVEVRVGDAKLVKAFTLSSPSRVVVDLSGGKLPKEALTPGNGVSRVRFGTPAPGTSRVVVELDRDAKATHVETWVSRGVLSVTFQ